MKKYLAILIALAFALVGMVSFATPAQAAAGDSASDPIVVTSPDEVPADAVEDEVSTYVTDAKCDTTRSWVLTVPTTEDTSHQEWGSEERVRTYTPGEDEVSHLVYSYEKTVTDYKIQYHVRKFVQTRERTYTPGTEAVYSEGIWAVWSPNDTRGPQDYTPVWPEDERGTWRVLADSIPPGHAGPNGVYQQGGGNSSYFYRQNSELITAGTEGGWGPWSEYGPWTAWTPASHEDWVDVNAPIGVPLPHASWQVGNTQYERVWQVRPDGLTREVENGSHKEFSGEVTETLGEPWVLLEGYPKTVVDSEAVPASYGEWSEWTVRTEGELVEPVLPDNTDTHEYRPTGPVTITDSEGTPELKSYYAWTDGKVCDVVDEGNDVSTSGASSYQCGDDFETVTTETTTTHWTSVNGVKTYDEPVVTKTSDKVDHKVVKCDTPNPPNTPKTPDTPVTTVLPNAGMDDGGSNMSLPIGLALALILAGGGLLAVRKRA